MLDIRLYKDFAALLNDLISEKKLTLKDAERILGVSRAMIAKYRRKNGSTPDDEKLKKFAAAMKYEYNELLRLVHDKEEGTDRQSFPVYTERGAIVGRTFEKLPNDQVRAAFYELLLTLSKDLGNKKIS